ncbi:MAG TPA: hypothetical protein VHN99_11150 [Deinococcales bacterium]|nr:hypothetical protein [Deinococcales bacterium]
MNLILSHPARLGLLAAGAAVLLGGCGLIKVPLPVQSFKLTRQDVPGPAVALPGGTLAAETPGAPLDLQGLPPLGTGEVTGGTVDFTLTVTPPAGTLLTSGGHTVGLTGAALRVAFYRTDAAEPACGAAGFEAIAKNFEQTAPAVKDGSSLSVTSSLTLTPDLRAGLTAALQEAIAKDREGGWSLKACVSGTLLVDGAPALAGTSLQLQDAEGNLTLNGVL